MRTLAFHEAVAVAVAVVIASTILELLIWATLVAIEVQNIFKCALELNIR
jgi:hypothetical protein